MPHEFLARREERSVRTAEAERHAEALRVAEYAIGTGFTGGRRQRQRQ
jgi:hypothetical protein